ncbi:MAG: hypothetical protein ABSE48_06525 [Verrucomicrobiota bacterium]|jgi:hypothetical protein
MPSRAQVPPEFSDLYPVMESDLTNFEATLDAHWNGTFYTNAQFAAVILPATDGGEGAAITNVNYLAYSVIPFLNALQQMGIKTVKVSLNFPYLYQPFYDSPAGQNYPAGYTNMLNFASNLVAQARQRKMKIIIPTQNLFPFEVPAVSNYYASLTFAQYTNGRSAQIQTIARVLKPDVLMMQSEPVTEVDNLTTNLSFQLNDPVTDTNMLMGFLNDLKTAGLRTSNTLVGAGMGTWQPNFDTYLTNFANLPLDILDVHVYPINRTTNSGVVTDFLQRTLQMADAAHSHGMKIGMGEFWLQKERDNELASPPSQLVFEGRNTYSFWSPLDREMLLCMVKLAHYKQYEFIDPFFTDYFFAYLDYTNMQPYLIGLSPDAAGSFLNSQEYSAAYAAISTGTLTNSGVAYEEYMSTNQPVLELFPTNGNNLAFSWTPLASAYVLESTNVLTGAGNWIAQTMPPRAVGADYSAIFKTTNGTAFYRLRLP